MTIKGKIAVVTGASGGIGLATAKLLAGEGAKVALIARSEEKLTGLVRDIPESMFVVCDMAKGKDIKSMVTEVYKHYGRIDILINNAGQGYDAPIEEVKIDIARHIYDLDVFGPLIAMQEVIPIMKKHKQGTIINVSSSTALMTLPAMSVYSSAKRAIAQISLVVREELKSKGINVSVVYPYVTQTDFERNTIRGKNEDYDTAWMKHLPHHPDPPEHVALTILHALKSGEAEVYAHNWMKR